MPSLQNVHHLNIILVITVLISYYIIILLLHYYSNFKLLRVKWSNI